MTGDGAGRIPDRESLRVEFKSDRPGGLPDHELVDAAMALANTAGGELWLGVEDDGTATGVVAKHADADGAVALIANRTTPPLETTAQVIEVGDVQVLRIRVPQARPLVCTTRGTYQRRRMKEDGTPECVAIQPHEITTRQADLGLADYSTRLIEQARPEDLDAVERQRLRNIIERYRGDTSLVDLPDRELDEVLGLGRATGDGWKPTACGLLLIGREPALRQHLPGHEVAFQVLSGSAVRVNEFRHTGLLSIFEEFMTFFTAQVREEELNFLGQRIPVPNYDRTGFREALINALIHRDYTTIGAIHVQFNDDGFFISNPGGFVEGVSKDNILVTPPRPRNPLLADVVKRIGLAERTGRGVDRIYEGCVRYGRLPPSYDRSVSNNVTLTVPGGKADLEMLRCIIEHEDKTGAPLPVEALIVLSALRREQHQGVEGMARMMQRDPGDARAVLDRLVEAGMVTAHGRTKGRTYTLSAAVFKRVGDPAGYIHQAGFTSIQQEQMVLRYIEEHGSIRRAQAKELCHITDDQATKLLRALSDKQVISLQGFGRGARYVLP